MNRKHFEQLLRDTAHTGVYRAPQQGISDLLAAAEASGLTIHRIDLAPVRDKSALFDRLATALEFPDWFGHNWDALADCLSDLSWLPADGYVILLEHCDDFQATQAEDFATALQVFAAAVSSWREENVPFWVLVDMQADGIACLPRLT